MNKKLFFLVTVVIIQLISAMDGDDGRDLCSQLSLPIRKKIMFPLLQTAENCRQAKDILMSIGLISKKSYEQINCINFTKEILGLLALNMRLSREAIAEDIHTCGMQLYNRLGNQAFNIMIGDQPEIYKHYRMAQLLEKGFDVNFEDKGRVTLLMQATALHNARFVHFLVRNGANVNAANHHGDVRHHSFLFITGNLEKKSPLQSCLSRLIKVRRRLSGQYCSERKINERLYKHEKAIVIRDAIMIDQYLKLCAGYADYNFEERLDVIDKIMPGAQAIVNIITNVENNKKRRLWFSSLLETLQTK